MSFLDIEKLNTAPAQEYTQSPGIDFKLMLSESYVDPSEELSRPPVAISIGESEYKGSMYPIQFGSYGDFSCIVGASKSRKTFFKSMIIAGYIGGNANILCPSIKGHEHEGKYVIDIDTEQSKWHTQRVTRRICEMVGDAHPMFRTFSLRKYSPENRLAFIDWIVNESEFKGKIGLLSIDGTADLVTDFNSLEQAKDVENKLLSWTDIHRFHCLNILHRNFGTTKPVGHLGSMVLKKAETIACVETDGGITTVKCEYSRNQPFDDIHFEVNQDWLPQELGAERTVQVKNKNKVQPNF